MSGFTIYQRDGTVLFYSPTATTTAQAVNELVAEARRNLRNANLSYADLRSANLSSANLRYANLSSADLSFANLSSANLRYADLSSADLRSADLRNANLSSANLRGANLRNANLSYADLSGADLSGAVGIGAYLQVGPIDNWWVSISLEEAGWRFRAGCRYLSEFEARAHWNPSNRHGWSPNTDPEHGARMLAGVDALIALAKAHNWPERLVVEAEPAVAS